VKVHAFFDAKNIALFSIGAAVVASDSITTQRMVGTGRFEEQDPIAKPFVNNGWKGQALISAIGLGGSVGLSYVFHKLGHHKMERYVGLSLIGIELAATVHNSRLEAGTQSLSSEPVRAMKGVNQPRMRDSAFVGAFGKPYTLVGNSGTERSKFLASH
jgi:hypothetical protein